MQIYVTVIGLMSSPRAPHERDTLDARDEHHQLLFGGQVVSLYLSIFCPLVVSIL